MVSRDAASRLLSDMQPGLRILADPTITGAEGAPDIAGSGSGTPPGSTELLARILESIDDIVVIKNLEGTIIGVNGAAERFFDLDAAHIVGHPIEDIYPPETASRAREFAAAVLARAEPLRVEEWYRHRDGTACLLEESICPLKTADGKVVGLVAVARDITLRRIAETAEVFKLSLGEAARIKTADELATFALAEIARACHAPEALLVRRHTPTRATLVARYGEGSHLATLTRDAFFDLEENNPLARCFRERRIQRSLYPSPGAHEALFMPVLRGGEVVAVIGVAGHDAFHGEETARFLAAVANETWSTINEKREEEALAEHARRLDQALKATKAGLWTWFIREGIKEYDEHWAAVTGRTLAELEPITESTWASLLHPDDAPANRELERALARGELPVYEAEVRLRRKDGTWAWILDRGEVIEWDASGKPVKAIGLIVDISASKLAGERLKDALLDKEALLHELYHRTNNTLQLINAMLELKKPELPPGPVRGTFDQIQAKITAMALAQENMYQAGSLAKLELGGYLRDLVLSIEQDIPIGLSRPEFRIAVEPMEVSVDAAIPCGILVSELVGNALMHAFPAGRPGTILVELAKEHDGAIRVCVDDDGIGPPAGFDPRIDARLGLSTVIGIGEKQLRGKVSFGKDSPGFRVTLRFMDEGMATRRLSRQG